MKMKQKMSDILLIIQNSINNKNQVFTLVAYAENTKFTREVYHLKKVESLWVYINLSAVFSRLTSQLSEECMCMTSSYTCPIKHQKCKCKM